MAYPTPEEAEDAFYAAMRTGDLTAMHTVWADHDGVACIHPGGAPQLGYLSVMQGWGRLLGGQALGVETDVLSTSMGQNVAVHVVSERLTDPRGRSMASLIATNIYEWSESGWRMMMHHVSQEVTASDEPPLLH